MGVLNVEELEKKAFEYMEKLVPYIELGYPDVEIPVYSALQISEAHIAGAKELENEFMLKLKDTILVRALKDSIIMNEKLSSQEQQELCAWIEAAMEFGENLDECAKENEQLKAQIEKMKSCGNCKYYNIGDTTCLKGKPHNSGGCFKDWELAE